MRFILITNQPEIAAYAADQGVNLVMLDLEVLGKADRQGHVDSWKSHHQIDELPALRAALPPGRLMVRINPLNPGSKAEIDAVVAAGADWIMVPMFRSAQELSALKALIAGRARLMPLVETVGALASISAWSALRPDAVHFGLNDLHLELGSDFMFQPLADDTLAGPCAALRAEGIPFGIGGVAKAGEGAVPPELVLGRHVDLGSNGAILSRTFGGGAQDLPSLKAGMDLGAELARLRTLYANLCRESPASRAQIRDKLQSAIDRFVSARRAPS